MQHKIAEVEMQEKKMRHKIVGVENARSEICRSFFSSDVVYKLENAFDIYRVAQNKIPHQTICNISATSGLILKNS